ncbi:MAG TPA: ATP-dependent DNA helicase [Terriglobia bacterium]|nr:ATP-dependent DNA helicase [Terriglobia bacterium]
MPVSHPRATEKAPLERIFGPKGWLARNHPRYEFRPTQLEMAEEVESALEHHRHLIVEAGTGTGKTLAYLAPILRSGQRVVVSTGTKNLQEQLFFKDIPFLKRLVPEIRAILMKGRQNYLCRQKLYDLEKQPGLTGAGDAQYLPLIRAWEERTKTGDRAELEELPDASALWPHIDARREACTGQKCPQFDRCFITWMHQRASEANLIVVNHHLFFADLALKRTEYGSLLPEYAAVVFDEAHEIEDVATRYFGLQVSSYRLEELARDTEVTTRLHDLRIPELLAAVGELRGRASLFFELFPTSDGRSSFDHRTEFLEKNQGTYSSLLNALVRLQSELMRVKERPEEITNLANRASELRENLELVMEGHDRNMVFWWERRGRGMFLEATPIDVGPILRERLFERVDTVILTSATLAVAGNFSFLRARLGVQNAKEKVFPSHFNFGEQALLYIPAHLPDPREPDFPRIAAEEVTLLLKLTRGRAFVLFTSYAQMRDLYERVRPRLQYPLMIQGSAPAPVLLKKFRSTSHGVLFATSAFWQGVDVQGQQLSAVIIDRLPFAVPTDPVVAARVRQINEDGGSGFTQYQLPEAVIALKQGFGRLIRSENDHGLLAILDNRLVRKGYGKIFFDSLPPYRRANRLDEVKAFMQRY